MTILTTGEMERHSFAWFDSDGPITTGSAVVQAFITDAVTGDLLYLQSDLTTFSTSPHTFATIHSGELFEFPLTTPLGIEERILTVEAEHDSLDPVLPKQAAAYYVQGKSTDDIYDAIVGLPDQQNLGFGPASPPN